MNIIPEHDSPASETSWVLFYLNAKWNVAGDGDGTPEEGYNCWGLLRHVYKSLLGIDVPKYSSITSENIHSVGKLIDAGAKGEDWSRVEDCNRLHMDAVALSKGKIFHHVGIYLNFDGGLILHAHDGGRVVAQRPSQLRAHGWSRIEYFRHGNSTTYQ